MKRDRLEFSLQGLGYSLLSSYVCAGVFVVVNFLSLPQSDMAYRRPLALLDPFVWTVAILVATIIGVVIFPVAVFALWQRDVRRSGLFVLVASVLTVVSLTPWVSAFAIPLSVLVAVVGLLFCRFSDLPFFRLREEELRDGWHTPAKP